MSELDTVDGQLYEEAGATVRGGGVSVVGGAAASGSGGEGAARLAERYLEVRRFTERLTSGLAPEDMVVQSMPDVSPTKWHLAHTSWFFEQFVLLPHLSGYSPYNPAYLYLFNSYYHQAGERHCRDQRGYISRPTVAEVIRYRRQVDLAIADLLAGLDEARFRTVEPLITLGLHHEQQHQELLLTDIKHVFSVNPLRPAYCEAHGGGAEEGSAEVGPLTWVGFAGGVREIGHGGDGFAYDNEGPRHLQYVMPFEVANRLVTNGEYLEFIEDGGYRRPELWLSLGWAAVEQHGWTAPFYWEQGDDGWFIFTLAGPRPLDPSEPVSHLTYFEADAYARWAGARLPTEAEWEVAASSLPIEGNFVESGRYHPAPLVETTTSPPPSPPAGSTLLGGVAALGATEPAALLSLRDAELVLHDGGTGEVGATTGVSVPLRQFFGDLWEWTASPYTPYPGFRPAPGAIGEYNGKFMCNQYVLRGGSCATSRSHIRPTYRNFFPPDASWQFTGVRLARDPG